MGCSSTGYRVCLLCSNVTLLFIGVAIFILGIKMNLLLQVVLLTDVPIIAVTLKAVVATGTFVSFAGVTGFVGACYEAKRLLIVHLISLGTIVIMQFGLGVTILFVKKAIEDYIGTTDCDKSCATALDVIVLDYALPSAGLMMTIIIVEAMMMYSAIRFYLHVRDAPKIPRIDETFVIENVQMRDVASPLPSYIMSPHNPQMYTPQMNYGHQARLGFLHYSAPPRYNQGSPKPPLYSRLPPDLKDPPTYLEASAQVPKTDDSAMHMSLNSI